MCVCVCVCVSVSERERERVCVCETVLPRGCLGVLGDEEGGAVARDFIYVYTQVYIRTYVRKSLYMYTYI